ncbi:DNA-binding protein [Saccharibacillus sp. CPCC 101409]|uniref:DNA-binding protein n=1 Tax=Saccharibacillus sp. CPCC 101409 TaxID=3058041 RepID=UPI002671AA2E|nr:DNA-binding protein [Saccharibacillus sp. CPCC 101409]MDO3410145.1 DNA-binding protein [Saccharibacillus sp. CPCC 101409]
MQTTTTLRSEIEKGIAALGMNFSSFGELSGINRGIFSAILNGNPPKPISLNQMEAITRAFGKPAGWMFDLYIEECFYDGKPNRRRVEPFLIRCAELGLTDCIREVLNRLLEDLKHVSMIFDIGETLFTSGKKQESLIFYECVVENEKYNHAERLAVSYYRIFRAALGEDNEKNLRAAMRFEPFCGKLPDHHRLDGLLHLTHTYYSLGRWTETEIYADELHSFSQTVYQLEKQRMKNRSKYTPLPTERPLVVYYGQGFLMKEAVLVEHYQKLEEAKIYNQGYTDLSWFEGLNEKGHKEVEKFKIYASANAMNIEILKGNTNILPSFIDFLDSHPSERLPSLLIILQSANKYNFKINEVLFHFHDFLKEYEDVKTQYNKRSSLNWYVNICFELATYYLNSRDFSFAINSALRSLEMAIIINNKDMFMKCVPFFEEFRNKASEEQKNKYENLVRSVYQNA